LTAIHIGCDFFVRNKPMSAKKNLQTHTDPNIKFLQQTIHNMEDELSAASFSGDRKQIPLLMKQLKESRKILSKMTGED